MAKRRSKHEKASRKYRIELTPLSILLWGGCLFFALTWIFVLGILVGRGYLPGAVAVLSDLKSQIGTLQEMVSHNRSGDSDSSKESESDPKLAFYEKLSGKDEETNAEWEPQRGIEALRKKLTEPQRQREILVPPKNVDQKQAVASEKAQSSQSQPKISDEQYTVQLASLGEKDRAEKMTDDLVGRGYPAFNNVATVKGKTYYRVRCGRFPRRQAARDYAERLLEEEGIKGLVIRIE